MMTTQRLTKLFFKNEDMTFTLNRYSECLERSEVVFPTLIQEITLSMYTYVSRGHKPVFIFMVCANIRDTLRSLNGPISTKQNCQLVVLLMLLMERLIQTMADLRQDSLGLPAVPQLDAVQLIPRVCATELGQGHQRAPSGAMSQHPASLHAA
uniref:Uncharacterized protein n=1 Tax=Timema poppense TaxID=170557 RepID=A0A7R9DB81_TIMPO|nr:unnamed protein product [Timema poppensis]